MPQPLRLMFLVHLVTVRAQTCFTECLGEAGRGTTNVTVMTHDGSAPSEYLASREWLRRKTLEFNALFPTISIELFEVNWDEMVDEALEDMVSGTNRYHAHIIPLMNLKGGTARLADHLMDLSTLTVANVNQVAWQTIGRFYRAYSSLYHGRVVALPLAGDSVSLYYRADVFEAYGLRVPRTLQEYVHVSQVLHGEDFNGDGEADYGSCMPHIGGNAAHYWYTWVGQVTQYRGATQGFLFDTETLNPLLENPAVQEVLKLWKQVAALPGLTGGATTTLQILQLWTAGRCAMAIGLSSFYTALQEAPFAAATGTAVMPGSERVWWREGEEVITCNTSFCRHVTEYEDGFIVNHAPAGLSIIDGAVNGQIGRAQQLAAYTFLTWLMSDANMLEAVVEPPNDLLFSMVKPSLLTPRTWTPYNWSDPGVSMFCSTSVANMEHPNAMIPTRLPIEVEIIKVAGEVLSDFWNGHGAFADIDEAAGAAAASEMITAALQQVIDRGDRKALIVMYQKSLNIYDEELVERSPLGGELFPTWAVYAVSGILSSAFCLALTVLACWLLATVWHRMKQRAKEKAAWEDIADAAERYAGSLGCSMVLVSATDFLDLGSLVHFESLRDQGRLRWLDTVEKVLYFRNKFLVVYLSHQWLLAPSPDANGVLYKTMCAAIAEATKAANMTTSRVFLWVDYCSVPQEHLATRELYLASIPQYVSLCDYFIVIAPPVAHDDFVMDLSTHFMDGWCRTELLARLVGSGVGRLFLCEACDGSLQQATEELVTEMDLSPFLGVFRCCSTGHVGRLRCDREKLRTPMLGVYAQYLRHVCEQGAAADQDMTRVLQLDQKDLFPRTFEFATVHADRSSSVQVRELFGPLVEMLKRRIRAPGVAPTEHSTGPVVETAGVDGLQEDQHVVIQSLGTSLESPARDNDMESRRPGSAIC